MLDSAPLSTVPERLPGARVKREAGAREFRAIPALPPQR
jgi:hypothetical protein